MHSNTRRRRWPAFSALAAAALMPAVARPGALPTPDFPGNDSSYSPAISADGRYVAYMSLASNLVAGDSNGVFDVFVLDRTSGALTRASTNEYGGQANGQSWSPAISADGRFVAFASNAGNLVAGDTNGAGDVFRKDLTTGAIIRVSVGTNGEQGVGSGSPRDEANIVSISANGRFVAFQSCLSGLDAGSCGAFVRDVGRGQLLRASNEIFARPALGARTVGASTELSVAITSRSTSLPAAPPAGPGPQPVQNVYLARTLVPDAVASPVPAFTYRLVSASAPGVGGNGDSGTDNIARSLSMSSAGTRIAFVSGASNLSAGDANGELDAFLYDTETATLTRETNGIANFQARTLSFPSVQAALSPDGVTMLYFDSGAPGTGDWYVKAVPTGPSVPGNAIGVGAPVPGTRLEEVGHGAVADGGLVAAWQTPAFDLPGTRYDTASDIFISTGVAARTTSLGSRGRIGTDRDGHSRVPAISADSATVAFSTHAWGFDATDPGANRDVYVRNLATGTTVRASSLFQNTFPADAYWPDLSADGRRVSFLGVGNPQPGSCSDGFGAAWVATLQPTLTMQCVDADASGIAGLTAEQFLQPALSDDGNWVAFGGTDNANPGLRNLYLRDLVGNSLVRVPASGAVGFEFQTIQLSREGRYLVHSVGFSAVALYDRVANTDTVISRFGGGSGTPGRGSWPSISADGNWVAFVSRDNLTQESPAPRGDQVFIHERATQALTRVVGDSVGRNDGTLKARTRLSADGRFLAYVVDDLCVFRCASRSREIVLYDREQRSLRTVSLTPSWGRPDGPSAPADEENGDSFLYGMDLSGDGSKLVYASAATNLAPSDRNAADDIYVVDTGSQVVALASGTGARDAGDSDRLAPSISGDGSLLTYALKDRDGAVGARTASAQRGKAFGDKWSDVAIQSTFLGEVRITVSPTAQDADGDSGEPSVSGDGRFVAYQTDATNLTPQADANGATDIVLFDTGKGANESVTKAANGAPANGASFAPSVATGLGDKWAVTFTSSATNLGATTDANGVTDVMLAIQGSPGSPPATTLVSASSAGVPSNGPSAQSDVDAGATFVTFASLGNNLAPGDTNNTTDVFMRDLGTGQTALLSTGVGGMPANGPSAGAVGDKFGTAPAAPPIVAFETDATNLAANDLNGSTDVVAWTPAKGMFVVSRGLGGVPANGTSSAPQVSRGGRYIAFVSTADNIAPNDTNGLPDTFVYDTTLDTIERVSLDGLGQETDDITTSAAVAAGANGDPIVVWDSAARLDASDTDQAFDLHVTAGDAPSEPILLDGDLVFRSGFE